MGNKGRQMIVGTINIRGIGERVKRRQIGNLIRSLCRCLSRMGCTGDTLLCGEYLFQVWNCG